MRNEERRRSGPCSRATAILVLLAAAPWFAPPCARAADRIEVGARVGYHEPINQDDASDEVTVAGHIRIPVTRLLRVEPGVIHLNMDRGPYRIRSVIQEVRPWTVLGVTASLTVGRDLGAPGFHPYARGGAGVFFLRKDEAPAANRPGFIGGIGMVIGMNQTVSADVGASALRITLDGGGARGLVDLHAGLNYYFGVR